MPLHYPHQSVILSTGVLTREPATVSAVINIVNLDEAINLYEIRISYPPHSNIIANCFGRSLPPYTSQEGNTVYHKQLVKINENITRPYYHP
ncbi:MULTISPECIES: hypothetical protein [Bacillus]|uniref:hypothetical protein n=1 Tax=Bacillus TaxID=1386 RepID=UPI000535547E|nr:MULTISPECIES: hypothetical protein [Bacillus]AYF09374.1 hypothetical protein MLA2C4_28225 [Bacillus mobilis]PEU84745.1 hypothetical protein CN386_04265 [Bacillus cereus]PGT68161.1 hypothetical protein COD14_18195 [Bacillus cereus]PGV94187.1 hypothetical protein COD86_16155 [Bacillus cereus]HDX9572873.1 hypothetical protein [Bacillus mobilis]